MDSRSTLDLFQKKSIFPLTYPLALEIMELDRLERLVIKLEIKLLTLISSKTKILGLCIRIKVIRCLWDNRNRHPCNSIWNILDKSWQRLRIPTPYIHILSKFLRRRDMYFRRARCIGLSPLWSLAYCWTSCWDYFNCPKEIPPLVALDLVTEASNECCREVKGLVLETSFRGWQLDLDGMLG